MRQFIIAVAALTAILAGCATQAPVREAKPQAVPAKPAAAPAAAPAAPTTATAPAAPAPVAAPAATTRMVQETMSPQTLASLQPFQTFGKGAGEGFARTYKPRTKADLVALLRDKARWNKEMRVSCARFVQQVAEANRLPWEGCAGAAAAIERDPDYAAVACRNEMFQRDNWLVVTNERGNAFGVWHRDCLPGEQVLTYRGVPVASTTCMNGAVPTTRLVSVPVPPVAAPAPQPVPAVTAMCPRGFTYVLYAISLATLPEPLRSNIWAQIQIAGSRPASMLGQVVPAASRTYLREIRELMNQKVIKPAPVDANILVRLIDPATGQVAEDLGTLAMKSGYARIRGLTAAQIRRVIESEWPIEPFVSPRRSLDDAPILWTLPIEWGKHCTANAAGFTL